MDKIFKPISCNKCPAVTIEKGMLVCTCMRELKANPHDDYDCKKMYDKCSIEWDKEENK